MNGDPVMVKVKLKYCGDWEIEISFVNLNRSFRIGVPASVKELQDMRDDPRGWITIDTDYPPISLLEDAIQLYKLVNNKEFVKELNETIGKLLSKYIECEER